MRSIVRAVAPLSLLITLGIGTSAPAQAGEPDDFIVQGQGRPSASMAIEDVRGIADATGLTKEEVVAAYREQAAFSVTLASIRTREQGIYFSAGWEPGDDYDAWIGFTEKPSDATIADVQKLALDVQIRTDAPATEAALDSLLEKLVGEVRATKGVSGVSGFWDGHDGRVEIAYSGDAEVSLDALGGLGAPVPVEIASSGAEQLHPEVVRGGMKISNGWWCTSAFALIGGGVLTAGHCPNVSYSMAGSAYPLPYSSQHIGSYGDFQRHTSVDSTSNQIRISSAGALRSITSIGIAAVGASVCNYGSTRTVSSCATVLNTSWCGTMETGENVCRMVETNGTFTNDGDSGGPWYITNTALGVHSGEIVSNSHCIYGRADNAQAILGVTIKLS